MKKVKGVIRSGSINWNDITFPFVFLPLPLPTPSFSLYVFAKENQSKPRMYTCHRSYRDYALFVKENGTTGKCVYVCMYIVN